MTIKRRDFIAASAALAGTLALPKIVAAADTIKLGSILDTSGIFDAYGKPMDMAMRLAVKEINEAGGLNGKQIEVVSYDTQSDMALYTQFGQQLVRRDKADVVHGGILSASREAIRQTMRKAKTLYFYNVLYEGGVCDRNIFINGVTPAQQVEALVPFAMERAGGNKVYILAADYNYGQITAKWIQKYVEDNGGEVIAVDFFPLDVSDFGSTIAKIQGAAPDLVIAPLVGGAHLSFFRQWAAAGMKDKIPLASTTMGVGNEHKVLTPEEGNGIMVAYNYSQELDTPANKAFKQAWADAYGDSSAIHEIAVFQLPGRQNLGRSGEKGRQHGPRCRYRGAGVGTVDRRSRRQGHRRSENAPCDPRCASDGRRGPGHEGDRHPSATPPDRHTGRLRPGRQSGRQHPV